MKKRLLALTLPLAAVSAGAVYMSNRLFNFAFKRVNYVPETSADKQKYADDYYAYVDWYRQIPHDTWYLNENDPENKLVASYIPNPAGQGKTVIISHGYKGNRETMANYARCFMNSASTSCCPMTGHTAIVLVNTSTLAGWID